MLHDLGRKKTGRVDVVCPGFVADCLETLEEIAIEGKTAFLNAGGKEFHSIPCLNESDDWIHALADIAPRNLLGWVGTNRRAKTWRTRASARSPWARSSEERRFRAPHRRVSRSPAGSARSGICLADQIFALALEIRGMRPN